MAAAPPSSKHPGRRPHNWSAYDAGDKMIERLRTHFRGDLFDLGCGDRSYETYLRQYCDRYIGVDWGHSLHGRFADLLADLNKPLPIQNEVADTVISFSVMEHLREPLLYLQEAARIMRSGGKIVLQVPFMWRIHEEPHDFFRFTRFGLEHLFHKAGLMDVEVKPTTGFWVMWTLKLNYQMLRLLRGPRPVRVALRACLNAAFWIDQHVAIWLDSVWPDSSEETAGYFVIARKP